MRIKVVLALGALAATHFPGGVEHRPRRANAQAATMTARKPASRAPSKHAGAPTSRPWRPSGPATRSGSTSSRIPDGSIAFGSAVDGRLLATFPAKGDWTRKAVWADPELDPASSRVNRSPAN